MRRTASVIVAMITLASCSGGGEDEPDNRRTITSAAADPDPAVLRAFAVPYCQKVAPGATEVVNFTFEIAFMEDDEPVTQDDLAGLMRRLDKAAAAIDTALATRLPVAHTPQAQKLVPDLYEALKRMKTLVATAKSQLPGTTTVAQLEAISQPIEDQFDVIGTAYDGINNSPRRQYLAKNVPECAKELPHGDI